jgi:rSAM/selenodomain-associated transferase 1
MTGDVLMIFLKEPRPGTVKTRLAREVGEGPAARLYRALAEAEVAATTPRADVYSRLLFFTPPEARLSIAEWFPREALVPQSTGDLGQRMAEAFKDAFARGARRVCIIGTDVPWVDRALVEDALLSLDDHDVVLGPAHDGGYYLLALDRPRPELFSGIAWSTPSVLAATAERAGSLGLSIRLLPVLPDIDTAEDVRAHWRRLRPFLDELLAAELSAALRL